MINEETIARLNALCKTIATSSHDLEALVRELRNEADSQLKEAGLSFAEVHETGNPVEKGYRDAHSQLTALAVAASNLEELFGRAVTIRSKCAWWEGLVETGRGQHFRDISLVCSNAQEKG